MLLVTELMRIQGILNGNVSDLRQLCAYQQPKKWESAVVSAMGFVRELLPFTCQELAVSPPRDTPAPGAAFCLHFLPFLKMKIWK